MSLETSLENKRWIATVEYDNITGDYILPLSPDMLEGLDWRPGDTLEWINNHDGSWTLRKKNSLLTKVRRPFIMLYNKIFNKE
jgi:hypothetical protein